jgi:hypothetical protein
MKITHLGIGTMCELSIGEGARSFPWAKIWRSEKFHPLKQRMAEIIIFPGIDNLIIILLMTPYNYFLFLTPDLSARSR